jgi:hypothetical protein
MEGFLVTQKKFGGVVVLAGVLVPGAGLARGTGAIAGAVTEPTGSALAGVAVRVIREDAATGVDTDARSFGITLRMNSTSRRN